MYKICIKTTDVYTTEELWNQERLKCIGILMRDIAKLVARDNATALFTTE